MPPGLSIAELMEYTLWERRKWQARLQREGPEVLAIRAGPHGDGRFTTLGDLVRHMFSAEKRYVERLRGDTLTDPETIPNNDLEAMFRFGEKSREDLKRLVETFPAGEWETSREMKILDYRIQVSPRKIVMHVLMHEIRHWAQIATLLRLQGVTDVFHDFLFSPVMGGEVRG